MPVSARTLPALLVILLAAGTGTGQSVTFTLDLSWGTGFQATITIQNGGNAALNGWDLSFDWPHTITSIWDAQLTGNVGGRYTITDAGWNASIPAGGSVSFGLVATLVGTLSDPANGCLNGQPVPINGVPSNANCTTTLPPPPPMPSSGEVPPNRSGKRIVGFYTSWSIYGRNYHVPDIPADRLTHINYAFANISASGTIMLGDPYADTQRWYPGDSWAPGALRGSFNQLNILKEEHPHLKTFISVGGWTWSGRFSDVALTPASRQLFAQSCVNFMVTYGFDGIDVDWEYPVSGGLTSNTYRPQDKPNYTLLLAELRAQLDARGLQDDRHYLLTIAAPAGPATYANIELDLVHQHLDWVNIMAYDFHGSWSPVTNFNAALHPSSGDPSSPVIATSWNGAAAIQGYLAAGIPAGKILLGVPFYGRGWQGVPNVNNGLYQPHAGIPQGTWEPGVFDYADLAANYVTPATRHWHVQALVPWFYDPATGVMISYDDPQSIGLKAAHVNSLNLGGIMFWELSGDDSQHVLVQTLRDELLEPAPYVMAVTTGNGTGDLLLNVWALPPEASHVILLASSTPAPVGPGTGPLLGLVPDTLFAATVSEPPFPGSPLHFPTSGSIYSNGPLTWPAGTFISLASQDWELLVAAYHQQSGYVGASGIAVLQW